MGRNWGSMPVQTLVLPLIAAVGLLSQLSPQVRYYLGPFLPTFISTGLCVILAIVTAPRAVLSSAHRFAMPLRLCLVFVVQAACRFLLLPSGSPFALAAFAGYVLYPLLALSALIVVGVVAEVSERGLHNLRLMVVLGWCLSVAVGVGPLIRHPFIARVLTHSGASHTPEYALARLGVGSFSCYTAMAILLPPLLFFAASQAGRLRLVAVPAVLLSALAIVLSSFTMASVVAAIGVMLALAAATWSGKRATRVLWAGLAAALLLLLPTLMVIGDSNPMIHKMTSKATRLLTTTMAEGALAGDETGRVAFVLEELGVFAASPVLGYIPHGVANDYPAHNHSSFADTLALFGLLGTALWFGFLGGIVTRGMFHRVEHPGFRYSIWAAWLLFLAAGVLNPIWNNPIVLTPLIVMSVSSRPARAEREAPTAAGPPLAGGAATGASASRGGMEPWNER